MAIRQFFVICRQPCNNCGGDGHIPILPAEVVRSESDAKAADAVTTFSYTECPDCKGARHVEFKVPLAEAIAELAMTETNQSVKSEV